MELGLSNTLLAGDSRLIDHIVGEVKSQGIFDQFRKECIADVDTKPAYQNLRTRVEGSVNSFLSKQTWKPDLNKNQLRETLRKHIHDEPYLDAGVERIVDQVVNPKVYSVFMSQIEDVVYKFLGMERPPKAKEKNGACGLKDLLPKDLDPVSPESDKNSLKDISLESVENDTLEERQEGKMYDEQQLQGEGVCQDRNKNASENGHLSSEERTDETGKTLKTGSNLNLNTSGRSDDKVDEEEEEVSPTFEPIDIMNECNISNDSHLSGISELTSHRSRSPDFSNDLSRDNFDCSNQDSQLSKVSSDSRLSIVTDFGSSNHDRCLTPAPDSSKEETTKDKYEAKSNKDNFKAIREESSKNKASRSSFDFSKSKDAQDYKESRDSKSTKSTSSKESSRDASDSGIKDKYEHKSSRDKSKDNESGKSSKSTKEKVSSKEKYYRDRNNEKKKSSSHSSSTKYDKHSKSKSKDKADQAKENSDKSKDASEGCKDNVSKIKEEKEVDKKDSTNKDKKDNKEAKDLKDLYKEKIRELREKKELTEKEKLNKDKEIKLAKESKDKKDSLKDKKPSKKEHRSSSSSSSSKVASVGHHESKSSKSEKIADGKDKKSDSKDRAKRDEKRLSKDGKSKNHCSSRTDLSEKSDKSDSKKSSKSEKDDKSGKVDVKKDAKISGEKTTNGKKDAKNHVHQRSKSSDRSEKSDSRKDSKTDGSSKDKKRKEDKKSKTKDDHSSLRKNSNDRRSSDRDGSNGSNNKNSPANSSCSNVTSHKSSTSGLTKENVVSNSSSETSDSIEEMQLKESKLSSHQSNCKISHSQIVSQSSTCDKNYPKIEINNTSEISDRVKAKEEEKEATAADLCETNLFAKKRSLPDKDSESTLDDVKIKKPKFAKNIHEAKKLMKLRKQLERQKSKERKPAERKVAQETEQANQSSATKDGDNLKDMPDDERVQIIEIPDEEYEEPYPEKHEPSLKFDESSIMMLGTESCANDCLNKRPDLKPTLSSMELRIKESLSEIVTSMPSEETLARKITPLDAQIAQPRNLLRQSSASSAHLEDSQESKGDESEDKAKDAISRDTAVDKEHDSRIEETRVSKETFDFADCDKNTEQSTEKDARARERKAHARDDVEEIQPVGDRCRGKKDEVETSSSSKIGTADSARVSSPGEDNEDCRYFRTDNEQSEKFSNFLETVELENSSLEDIIESLGGKVVTSMAAPPPTLHERSSSLLSNILANNNNDRLKRTLSLNEDTVHAVKKRKFTKKPRFSSACNTQGVPNGENFVMPLSPDSDVSATSEKTASSAVIKEEKSRNRSSHQRYSSDDLYKPRPLFSSSSRRSRRTNQA